MHHLTHLASPPIFDANGTSIITQSAVFWSFKAVQLVVATAGLSSNVIVGYTCMKADSVGRSLRRVLLSSCISHAFIAFYVLSKCAHAFTAMWLDTVESLESTVDACKVQEALYVIAYAHCALVLCTIGGERCKTLYERRRRRRMGMIGSLTVDRANSEAPRVVQVRTTDSEVTRPVASTTDAPAIQHSQLRPTPPMTISQSTSSSARGSSSCSMLMILLLIVSVGVVLILVVHIVWVEDGHGGEIQMSPSGILPTCSILLSMDTMLVLCLCCTVLLLYMLAVIIFLAAVVAQRMADQERHLLSRLHATTQLGKLLLTMVAVWGFNTIAIGIVMLGVLLDVVHRLDVPVIYANELLVYTMPPITALIHALTIILHVTPIQECLVSMCPCAQLAISKKQKPSVRRVNKQYTDETATTAGGVGKRGMLNVKEGEVRRTSMLANQTLVKINEVDEEEISLASDSFATSNMSADYLDIDIDLPDEKVIHEKSLKNSLRP